MADERFSFPDSVVLRDPKPEDFSPGFKFAQIIQGEYLSVLEVKTGWYSHLRSKKGFVEFTNIGGVKLPAYTLGLEPDKRGAWHRTQLKTIDE